jgi:hypothetical protein
VTAPAPPRTVGQPRATPASPGDTIALAVVLAATLVIPLGLRALARFAPASDVPASYLPALEANRTREAFDSKGIDDLRRLQPEFVVIGDSMAGSRLDATRLTVLLDYRTVAPIYHAGTGSAFWYLALKNWVVASQVHPRLVIIPFRDENLTDPMFRVTGRYRANLDRVARVREPVLNEILAMHTRGAWYRAHDTAATLYGSEAIRAWLEPRLVGLPVSLVVRPRSRPRFLDQMNEGVFGLQALRQMNAADMAHPDDESAFDFAANLPRSVLPEMFSVARHGGVKLAFVRVQRRPEAGGPPPQSPALRRYVGDLRAYIESQGGLFADDWGDPDQPLSVYTDGDHVSKDFRERYTELFLRKHPAFFR